MALDERLVGDGVGDVPRAHQGRRQLSSDGRALQAFAADTADAPILDAHSILRADVAAAAMPPHSANATALHSFGVRWLPITAATAVLSCIFTCYYLAVKAGHVDAWFPDITHCARGAPERYVFRAVMLPACVLMAALWYCVYAFVKGERIALLDEPNPILESGRHVTSTGGLNHASSGSEGDEYASQSDGNPRFKPAGAGRTGMDAGDARRDNAAGSSATLSVCCCGPRRCRRSPGSLFSLHVVTKGACTLGAVACACLVLSSSVLEDDGSTPWGFHTTFASTYFLLTLVAQTCVTAVSIRVRSELLRTPAPVLLFGAPTEQGRARLRQRSRAVSILTYQHSGSGARARTGLTALSFALLIGGMVAHGHVEHAGPLTEWSLTLTFVAYFVTFTWDFASHVHVAVSRPAAAAGAGGGGDSAAAGHAGGAVSWEAGVL